MTKQISLLDRTFWLTESENNPKHVAGLQILEKPDEATADYVENLYHEMRTFTDAKPPFNCRVRDFLRIPIKLVPVDELDMDYHVQLHVIDDVNDKSALHEFVANLHEEKLDSKRPLWQYHLVHDNHSKCFAIYLKVHHLYGDGATLVRWFQAGYLKEKNTENFTPVWAVEHKRRKRPKPSLIKRVFSGIVETLWVMVDLVWILFRLLLKMLYINTAYMPIPFSGTKTMLTGQVKKGRVVSTVDLDFNRIKALSKRARASANEVLLCCIDIGVHQLLKDYGHTFEKALYTNMPINLRKPGENTGGNKIAIVPVRLAHGKKDPYLRLRQIVENHRIVKRAAKRSRPMAFSYYTILIQSFALLFEVLRISAWMKPIANILISNVPGPEQARYLKDAKLLSNYPISTMTPGGGVNITLITYNGVANVGMVCCDKNIRSLEPLARYCEEAFELLEKCIDDPSANIDDIGEKVTDTTVSIVGEGLFGEEPIESGSEELEKPKVSAQG